MTSQLPHAAAVIPVRPGGDILLQLRDDRPGLPGANRWSTIGGAVEPGETPEQAAYREAVEEIGRGPEQLVPLGLYQGIRFCSHLFATPAMWPLDSLILGEGQGVDWLSPAAVRSAPLAKGIGTAIVEFVESDIHHSLAAGGCAEPVVTLGPLTEEFARALGVLRGRLVAVAGATAAFVRRLWDVLDGARVTASMAADERADVALWWPRGDWGRAAIAGWRAKLSENGVLWCVLDGAAERPEQAELRLRDAAYSGGFRFGCSMAFPSGSQGFRLDAAG